MKEVTKELLDAVVLGPNKLGPLVESFIRAEMSKGCCCNNTCDMQQIRDKVLENLKATNVYENFDKDVRAQLSEDELQQLVDVYTSPVMDKFNSLYRQVVDPINRLILSATLAAIKESKSK